MSRICFVSNEIYPTKPGGAATLIYHLAEQLLLQGHDIIFLLDISKAEFQKFFHHDRLSLPNVKHCTAYHLDTLCNDIHVKDSNFSSRYTWESFRYDYGCRKIYQIEQPDLIEFVDYCGPAFYSLNSKIAGISYQKCHISVRIHGPIEIIDRNSIGPPVDIDRFIIYGLERQSFRLAETILYPSRFIIGDGTYSDDKWLGQSYYSPPEVVNYPKRTFIIDKPDIILFYGRVYAVKGVDRFIDASISLLQSGEISGKYFYIIGPDSCQPPDDRFSSYKEYLLHRIPREYQDLFVFTGHITHEQLEVFLPRVKFAVLPSYYETYCYAAQELRHAGIPLIVSNIPAFQENFRSGVDAIFFDGSVTDLASCMKKMDNKPEVITGYRDPNSRLNGGWLDFYNHIPKKSWMNAPIASRSIKLLICLIGEYYSDYSLEGIIADLEKDPEIQFQVVLFSAIRDQNHSSKPIFFLGNYYYLKTIDHKELSDCQLLTQDAMMILRMNDLVDCRFIQQAVNILLHQPNIGYVNSWKWILHSTKKFLFTVPFSAFSEVALFDSMDSLSRSVFRTKKGIPLSELFDSNVGPLGEIAYIWSLEDQGYVGIDISEPLITQSLTSTRFDHQNYISHLLLKNDSRIRQIRLIEYLAMLLYSTTPSQTPLRKKIIEQNHLNFFYKNIFKKISKPAVIIKIKNRLNAGSEFSRLISRGLSNIWKWVKLTLRK